MKTSAAKPVCTPGRHVFVAGSGRRLRAAQIPDDWPCACGLVRWRKRQGARR